MEVIDFCDKLNEPVNLRNLNDEFKGFLIRKSHLPVETQAEVDRQG